MCNSVKHQTVYSATHRHAIPTKSSKYPKTAPVPLQGSAVSLDSVYSLYRVIMPKQPKRA